MNNGYREIVVVVGYKCESAHQSLVCTPKLLVSWLGDLRNERTFNNYDEA